MEAMVDVSSRGVVIRTDASGTIACTNDIPLRE
jgi:hypothetical protein